jgi:hypothetical protein
MHQELDVGPSGKKPVRQTNVAENNDLKKSNWVRVVKKSKCIMHVWMTLGESI